MASDDGTACCVCLDSLLLRGAGGYTAVAALACGHMFHRDCIAACRKRGKRECPLCRTKSRDAFELRFLAQLLSQHESPADDADTAAMSLEDARREISRLRASRRELSSALSAAESRESDRKSMADGEMRRAERLREELEGEKRARSQAESKAAALEASEARATEAAAREASRARKAQAQCQSASERVAALEREAGTLRASLDDANAQRAASDSKRVRAEHELEILSERADRAGVLAEEVASLRRQLARSERAVNRIRQRQQQQQKQQQQQEEEEEEGAGVVEPSQPSVEEEGGDPSALLQRHAPPPAKRARTPHTVSNPFGVSALCPHTRPVASAGHTSSFSTDTLRQRNGVRKRPTPVRGAGSNGSFVKHGYNALGERHRVVVGRDHPQQVPKQRTAERSRLSVPRARRVVLRGGLSVQPISNVFSRKAPEG